MMPTYIIIECGMPHTAERLPPYNPNRLAILIRSWESIHAFDETSRFALTVDSPPAPSIWQSVLAHTFYNPRVPVSHEWTRIGDRVNEDIIALVKDGLQKDDDVIQQWFDRQEVVCLLEAGDTWEKLLLAIQCIGGAHEVDPEACRFVESVFPNRK